MTRKNSPSNKTIAQTSLKAAARVTTELSRNNPDPSSVSIREVQKPAKPLAKARPAPIKVGQASPQATEQLRTDTTSTALKQTKPAKPATPESSRSQVEWTATLSDASSLPYTTPNRPITPVPNRLGQPRASGGALNEAGNTANAGAATASNALKAVSSNQPPSLSRSSTSNSSTNRAPNELGELASLSKLGLSPVDNTGIGDSNDNLGNPETTKSGSSTKGQSNRANRNRAAKLAELNLGQAGQNTNFADKVANAINGSATAIPNFEAERPGKLRRGLTKLAAQLSHIHIWVWLVLGATLLGVITLLTAWYMWPVRKVYVMGNTHLTNSEVRKLAGLGGKFGWWYYGAWRAEGLSKSPWVAAAHVTRKYPDKVIVQITERQPFLRWKKSNGEVVLVSKDGQILPNSTGYDELPLLTGWGPERLNEAMLVTLALARYTVQSVEYTPTGITVQTTAGTVWGGDLKSLLKYAGSVSMYPKKQMNIYPWGVSVRQ